MIAGTEKKYKKKLKKIGNMKKPPYLCSRNQKTKQYGNANTQNLQE